MQIKVSVVLPVYNGAPHVGDAVRSVLAQYMEDFELLIVNDGSTDGSAAILKQFQSDPRVRILEQENRGLIQSLNRGITEARGNYIARMDADDLCLPDRLGDQLAFMESNPHIALLGGFIATLDEEANPLAPVVRFPVTHAQIWAGLGRRPWVMCHPTTMYRRDAAMDVGMYNPKFVHAQDVEFFARMMTQYRAANLPKVVLKYRIRRGAVSSTAQDPGRISALLVSKMIDQWKMGQPFEPTPEQRQSTDLAIAQSRRRVTKKKVEAIYNCRVGRELLRGGQWQRGARHYAHAMKKNPWDWLPYAGIACALLHIGAGQAGAKESEPCKAAKPIAKKHRQLAAML